jgi:hypothetical protein
MSKDIKAIFMKTSTDRIAFQHLDNHMYLTNKKRIVFSKNTFTEETGAGFILPDCIDCLLSERELLFRSFYNAKQIMDLSDYFNIATDEDVNEFLNLVSLESHSTDSFIKNLNQSTRCRIYKINKARVLEKYSPEQICNKAVGLGINIKIDNGKIMIPNDNKEQKSFFTFLDEGLYKGPLSESTYITNSKRKLD